LKGINTMDSENYRDLAEKAWELYRQTAAIQRALNNLFWDEFIDLDNKDFERRCRENAKLPF
jgi:hypothetical protein